MDSYEFDSIWGVKSLIVTCSNLVVAWKVRLKIGKFLGFPSCFASCPEVIVVGSFLQIQFLICAKKRK
jgi:hypothetical protein